MKKISFFVACVAIAMAGMLSSCSSSDTPAAPQVVSDVVVDEANYTLKVTSNVDARFTYGNAVKQLKANKQESITFTSKEFSYEVSATGYAKIDGTVKFSDKQKVTAITLELVKESTNKVAQSAAKGNTVTNDAANQKATEASAAIQVPSDVNVSGNTTDAFSVTACTPAPTVSAGEDIKANQTEESGVLSLSCTPDGATFSKPVTLKATIPGASGLALSIPGASNVKQSGNEISFDVNHFSVWDIVLQATVQSITEGSMQVASLSMLVNNGENTFTFNKNIGVEGSSSNALVQAFIASNFGNTSSKQATTGKFMADGSGSATIVVNQSYRDISFKSGTVTFTVRVWGECSSTITTSSDTSKHSGGTGR